MSKQREWSLNNFLGEVRELKERMGKVLPSYLVSLKKTSQLPGLSLIFLIVGSYFF